ncbi:MAG: hypothetical protein EWV55_03360 [Microcystis viridis Mv_BB_P_19951000_S69]|uniref:Uncharacterized protein n=1 Tax=Microcystis viridis Mv_BB_P_19951000_S68D TaxID=2486270 RepID=A0A552HPA4_MICVR|nr:MAG: hypothetical protein EWV77_12415 [Microcystis viridis Mv_BB_P_19951000_S68D]TRU76472.1 MAG: hypothetical protein EWV47_06060 [Microcystis viridis Mv_BB_P_19951000_S68]TRU78121.1 MAG: hypothetical protein EWV55_03360 [Microcystis viridis Mv_BB_P_19951000_S69]TRU89194.1 MAG: hypothetical protein EWV46_04280 [Microcystis viridis Mv_BB_P_19951000_S69D]
MNTNCASYPQVNSVFGFKNFLKDNSYLNSPTPFFLPFSTLGGSEAGGLWEFSELRFTFNVGLKEPSVLPRR